MYFNDRGNTNIDSEFKSNNEFNVKSLKWLFIVLGVLLLVGGIVIFFIYFNGNKFSKINYFVTLVGEEEITLYQGNDYIELGYHGYDDKENNLTNDVKIKSNLDILKVGRYEIIYSLKGVSVTRYVNVVEKPKGATYLYLKGKSMIYLNMNEKYVEPGYMVIDTVDSNLSDKVKVTNSVDTSKMGTYKIVYSVVNSSGVTTSASRTVVVVGNEVSLSLNTKEYTNGNININVLVNSNYFDYLLLPDGNKTTMSNYSYKVTDNGTYKFISYDKKGNKKEASITVSNIDKVSPSGSCSGTYKDGKSVINVSASDNVGINKYVLDGKAYTTNKITVGSEIKTAKITVYDKAGNSRLISCNLENKNITYYKSQFSVNSYKSTRGQTFSYWLYVPEGATDNMPLIIFLHGYDENGNDYSKGTKKAITWGPGNEIRTHGYKFNAIILMPQCPSGNCWSSYEGSMMELANKLVSDYKINKNKISISGFSYGGGGSLIFVKNNPNYFSAAVPIGCNCDGYASYFKNVAVWAHAGDGYKSSMKSFVNQINNMGGNAKFSGSSRGHNIIDNRYSIFRDSEFDLINWMISQTKK